MFVCVFLGLELHPHQASPPLLATRDISVLDLFILKVVTQSREVSGVHQHAGSLLKSATEFHMYFSAFGQDQIKIPNHTAEADLR